MGLKEELEAEVSNTFRSRWSERDGYVVPDENSLRLGNDGIWLDAVVLYADMADSTLLVDNHTAQFSAEVYKTFLHCSAKIIRSMGGEITAYDGDRVMAVFIGDSKNSSAAITALKINYARNIIINPMLEKVYGAGVYKLNHVVGIDSSKLFVARTGIRGANDLVWAGRAGNHAAKLAALSHEYPTYITKEVYDRLRNDVKVTNGVNMWEARNWVAKNRAIYSSTWQWAI